MAISVIRGQRKIEEYLTPKCTTTDHVAPGSYKNTHNEPSAAAGESVVPFSSLQEKVLNQNKTTSAITPGPGQYSSQREYAPDERDGAAGPISFRSRAKRIGPTTQGSTQFQESTARRNPGPGQYDALSDWMPRIEKQLRPPVKPVMEVLDKTVPSIPLQKQPIAEKGSVEAENEMGNACIRHSGEREDKVGPAEYEPRGETITQKTAPQTSFHASKLRRQLWQPGVAIHNKQAPHENPGPGSYNSDVEPQVLDETAGGTHQFVSKSAMVHQLEVKDTTMNPGPGQYQTDNTSIEKQSQVVRGRALDAQGLGTQFGSASERVGWSRPLECTYVDPYHVYNVPGPGHYPAPKGFQGRTPRSERDAENAVPGADKRKIHAVHHPTIVMALQENQGPLQAFNSTDDRPCNKQSMQSTPAPWQYNKEEARGHSMNAVMRERAKVGRKGIFGTCADRFYGSPLAAREGVPDAKLDSVPEASNANADPRSMFQSASPRFHSAPGPREDRATKVGNNETPCPGTYEIDKMPNYRSPFRHPRGDHVSFGSSQKRYAEGKDIFEGHKPGEYNPGPGEYNALHMNLNQGGVGSKGKRVMAHQRVGCTTETVGPGAYGEIDTRMLKKTFNVSASGPTSPPVEASKPKRTPREFSMQV